MSLQLSISFDSPLTVSHNRHKGNDEILQDNREHFDRQARLVLNDLESGIKVTGKLMYEKYGIQDFRPRIAAIRKYHKLEFEKIKGGHGAKAWSLKK